MLRIDFLPVSLHELHEIRISRSVTIFSNRSLQTLQCAVTIIRNGKYWSKWSACITKLTLHIASQIFVPKLYMTYAPPTYNMTFDILTPKFEPQNWFDHWVNHFSGSNFEPWVFNTVQIFILLGVGTDWRPTWNTSQTEWKSLHLWRLQKSHKFEQQKRFMAYNFAVCMSCPTYIHTSSTYNSVPPPLTPRRQASRWAFSPTMLFSQSIIISM
jgi:hypothetical protein